MPLCGVSGVVHSPSRGCLSLGRAAGARCPFFCGRGGCGRGDPSRASQRALLRARVAQCGGGTRAPGGGGGGSCFRQGCPGLGKVPPPTALPWGRRPGLAARFSVGAGGAGVGTRHEPHSARSCELALRDVEVARGRAGGGGGSCLRDGCPGLGTVPPLTSRPWGKRPGPVARFPWARGGLLAWGPVTKPTAQARANWRCALWGRYEGALGGASHASVRGVRGWAPCLPYTPVLGTGGRGPLPVCCGRGRCGRGATSPTRQRMILRASLARCGGGPRAPGGGRLVPLCGVSGVVHSPSRGRLSLGRAAGARCPFFRGHGGCGRGDPSRAPQRALLRAGIAQCGGGTRARRGGGGLVPP